MAILIHVDLKVCRGGMYIESLYTSFGTSLFDKRKLKIEFSLPSFSFLFAFYQCYINSPHVLSKYSSDVLSKVS